MPDSRWKQVFVVIVVYALVALVFTLIAMASGPAPSQVGGTRPYDTIPGHFLELAGFGLLLGLGCLAVYGMKGLPFVFLTMVLTPLLDIDHLPIYLGYAQTIRPAHSVIFIAVVLAITAVTIGELDLELVVASAFMGHLAVDTGIFAPFSPLSFQYIQLDPYRAAFAVAAVLCALAAGAVMKMKRA